MSDDDQSQAGENAWLEEQNEDALRSREEADFYHGDPRYKLDRYDDPQEIVTVDSEKDEEVDDED